MNLASHPFSEHELEELFLAAATIWNDRESDSAFQGYVSADFAAIYQSLLKLRTRADTFLEWGSGLGVVSIMASRLGFDAYGIEVEPELVVAAQELAERFHASPHFATGSFIPEEFEADVADGDEFHRTMTADRSAYEEQDMGLRDFDVVYAYPWPEEHSVFRSIIRRCGSARTLYLRYDVREGLSLSRPAAKSRR